MILSKGDNGPNVIYLQQALSALGYPLQVSGMFDDMTELALMNFQGLRGLTTDGKYGPQTAAALQDSLGRNVVAATMLQQAMAQQSSNAPTSTSPTPTQNTQKSVTQAGFDVGSYAVPVILAAIVFAMVSK